ncbi:hypothetical protein Q5741_20020 [Paenibacillus sp. JX-17]|uniref:Photosynthesis system II assembly factor Ycf48/Hcf136-like domain-containing protein n=1 Tax=Paenibacillus lacisoli TaxID=3064525 RepID=A0ABT9CHD5_9BACL|nr:hypothetical protein [Paenibacillus sp. JX-17]MDO7908677.1 hypothetical protein [Paenibacillus sp. JX-17]
MKFNCKKWITKAILTASAMIAITFPMASAQPAAAAGTGSAGLVNSLEQTLASRQPAGLKFSDVQFLSDHIGRAAGSGFMIGTSNGGADWQKIYTGQWQFAQIDFTDNVNGWALASVSPDQPARYLIRTSDGGSHWTRISTGSVAFDRIQFLNKQTGFAYAYNAVYRTNNGGVSWNQVKTPANTRGAFFSNINNGFAVVVVPGSGYRVMKTTNGGSHWSLSLRVNSSMNATSGDVYSSGQQTYVILYGGAGMSQISYSMYATTDGGQHWTKDISQSTAGGGPAPGGRDGLKKEGPAGPGGHPGNMQLIGSSTAYLSAGSPAGEVVGIGRSANGGRSWNNLKSDIAGYSSVISFRSAQTGYLAVTGFRNPAVYVTHDGGQTWTPLIQFHEKH